MTTLTETRERQAAIMRAVNQVESILAPAHLCTDYNYVSIEPFNIERLAKNTDLISTDFCSIKVTSERTGTPGANAHIIHKVNIDGENFGYSFAPDQICIIKKRLEKSFKGAESYTKKSGKAQTRPQNKPAAEAVKKPLLINEEKKLINVSPELPKSIKKVYFCTIDNKSTDQANPKIDELKTVNFQIEGKYIDQIKAGKKTEDYRSISPVNAKKLCIHIDKKDLQPGQQYVTHFKEVWRLRDDLTHVRFFNGYKTDRKELLCELKKVELIKFIHEIPDGMKPGTICFVLSLGQIVVSKNFQ